MPIALRPRTKPPAERRDELMNAAERLFLARGFEGTTVEEITTGAEVANGTFYLHFATKGDVLEALRERFVQGLLDAVTAAVAGQPRDDWRGRLAAWARACAIGYLDAASLHHLVFVAVPPPSREGMARNVLVDHLDDLIAAGAHGGAWTIEESGFTAVFLFNALHGVVNQAAAGEPTGDRGSLLRALEAHVFRAVGLRPEAG